MTARISFIRLIQAGKKVFRDIFKPHQETKVKTKCQVFQHQKDVHHQVSHQAPQFVHSKSTLFSKIIPRVYYQSLASELRRQAAQRSWGRGSSPLFAFAGLAVLVSFPKNEDEILVDQLQEIGKTSQKYNSDFELGQFPYLSLDRFQLGEMIGKGCYAAVYEARLKVQSVPATEENVVEKTSEDDSDIVIDQSESDTESIDIISDKSDPESRVESDSDIIVIDQSESDTESIDIISDKLYPESRVETDSVSDIESDSDIIMIDQSESDTESIDIISDKSDPESRVESDCDIIMIDQSESDTESIDIISDKSDPEFKGDGFVLDRPVSAIMDSLGKTEFRTSLSSETDADDHFHDLDPNSFVILSQSDKGQNAGRFEHETGPPKYNLAIKIMYNYQIESKASAILREMEKEMVPAMLAATQAQMKEWDNGNKVRKKSLPPHPNIVKMSGYFVDPFPTLPEGLEHFPAALPKRLNPDGIGRNQTLFLVMKKYDMNLHQYLQTRQPDIRTRTLLLAQLLEGVVHMGRYGIAHRDMKSDNIFLDCSTGGIPQLVIGDFGCCLADSQNGLKLPYPTEEIDRGGNSALMAPEISNAVPGPNQFLDYSKSDLWSLGALAYELFDQDNPFYSVKGRKNLDSRTYRESDLPTLPDNVPHEVRKLVASLLKRDPSKRPTPEVAAAALSLYLWAPSEWWKPGCNVKSQDVKWQLIILAVDVQIRRLFQSTFTPEFSLKETFLSCLCMKNVQAAIDLLHMME
ncbi:hypothetical protein ACJMK2_007456 [Sinanodonta woodiana]|uniref:non-specific serine/threonine protein kinase n=1 Tax=Sinanodonta woodiana TaxID=1069815 RepID=A0ABD3VIL6_SINWO